jgi:hypothetical protein
VHRRRRALRHAGTLSEGSPSGAAAGGIIALADFTLKRAARGIRERWVVDVARAMDFAVYHPYRSGLLDYVIGRAEKPGALSASRSTAAG